MIFFNLIMQMVQAFQEFNGPYVITGGGPLKSTYLLPLYIYDEAFKMLRLGLRVGASPGCCSSSSRPADRGRVLVLAHWVFYAGDKRS